jgi:GntR family transcriptional regulator
MFFNIQPTNGLAIYDQITRQVKFAVACGSLRPGELVPSVRELARLLTVNPNTVSRAYRELQSAGVLAPRRGTGLEVTAEAVKKCRQERLSLIGDRLRSVLYEADQSGLDTTAINKLVSREISKLPQQKPHEKGTET